MSNLGGWFDAPVVYSEPGEASGSDPTTHLVYSDLPSAGFQLGKQMAMHPLGWALGIFAAGWAGGYLAWVALGKRGYSGGYGGLAGTPEEHSDQTYALIEKATDLWRRANYMEAYEAAVRADQEAHWAGKSESEEAYKQLHFFKTRMIAKLLAKKER